MPNCPLGSVNLPLPPSGLVYWGSETKQAQFLPQRQCSGLGASLHCERKPNTISHLIMAWEGTGLLLLPRAMEGPGRGKPELTEQSLKRPANPILLPPLPLTTFRECNGRPDTRASGEPAASFSRWLSLMRRRGRRGERIIPHPPEHVASLPWAGSREAHDFQSPQQKPPLCQTEEEGSVFLIYSAPPPSSCYLK